MEAKEIKEGLLPLKTADVEEKRTRSIGNLGNMEARFNTANQILQWT